MLRGRPLELAILTELERLDAHTARLAVPLKEVGQRLHADPWEYCQAIATLIDGRRAGIIGENIFRA